MGRMFGNTCVFVCWYVHTGTAWLALCQRRSESDQ